MHILRAVKEQLFCLLIDGMEVSNYIALLPVTQKQKHSHYGHAAKPDDHNPGYVGTVIVFNLKKICALKVFFTSCTMYCRTVNDRQVRKANALTYRRYYSMQSSRL